MVNAVAINVMFQFRFTTLHHYINANGISAGFANMAELENALSLPVLFIMNRSRILEQISQLDPVKDHLKIVQLNTFYDFPWDNTRALEFALFRTFAVSKIGQLLHYTREFEERTQKRYDDTDLILSEIIEHGYESERGKLALDRMNRMHGQFSISNDLMRYVLSTFVLEPYRWNMRFGYRKATPGELIANHRLWFEIGTRMGIKDIPETFEAMEAMNIAYEKEHFGYSEGGRKVADATVNLMLGWFFPKWMWGMCRPFMYALMDKALLDALKLPHPPLTLVALVNMGMGLRKLIVRLLPARRKPVLRTRRKTATYPKGYEIKELGVFYTEQTGAKGTQVE